MYLLNSLDYVVSLKDNMIVFVRFIKLMLIVRTLEQAALIKLKPGVSSEMCTTRRKCADCKCN